MVSLKAQTEAIGLVIIVILISLILIFVISLLLKPESGDLENRLLEIKANNLRNAVLKTTYCPGTNIKEELNGLSYDNSKCNSDLSALKTKIKELIDFSIKENYNITIDNYDFNLEISKGKCIEKITATEELTAGTDLSINIALCRR